MDPQPLRKSTGVRRAIAGAVAALAIGAAGIAWLASEGDRPPARVEATLPPAVIEEPRMALAPAAIASAGDAEVRAESPGEVQLCGGAWVKLKDDGEVDWDSVGAATKERVDALSASVVAAMASSADERAQGAALAIALHSPVQVGTKPSACDGDLACERELTTALKEWAERRDALARLAQDSSDPTLYGWAVRTCSVVLKEGPGQCQMINAAQWARLDATNAAPWIAVAGKARAERDSAGLDDALFRVSVAERYDPGEYKLGSILLDHVPDSEANLWGALALAVQALAFDGVGNAPTLLALCSAKDLTQDSPRWDACERSAEMLVKASTTRVGLVAGRLIGKHVGWSGERFEQLQKESRALEAAGTREIPTGTESLGCKSLRAQLDGFREFAADGQVAALRRRVAQDSVRTVAGTSVRALR